MDSQSTVVERALEALDAIVAAGIDAHWGLDALISRLHRVPTTPPEQLAEEIALITPAYLQGWCHEGDASYAWLRSTAKTRIERTLANRHRYNSVRSVRVRRARVP